MAESTLNVKTLEINPNSENASVKNHAHRIPNQSPYAKIRLIAPSNMKKTATYDKGKWTKAWYNENSGNVAKAVKSAMETISSNTPDTAIKIDSKVTPKGLIKNSPQINY